jgi:hypothetical protein
VTLKYDNAPDDTFNMWSGSGNFHKMLQKAVQDFSSLVIVSYKVSQYVTYCILTFSPGQFISSSLQLEYDNVAITTTT